MIKKVQFYNDTILISSSLDKTIILWELCTSVNKSNEICIKSRVVRRISSTKFYQEIIVTPERFICRKGNPGNEIKILKFKNIKTDLTEEALSDEYYKDVLASHIKLADRDKVQPLVHLIDKIDDTIMEMVLSPCQEFLLVVT